MAVPMPPPSPPSPVPQQQSVLPGMAPPRPAPMGYTHGIPDPMPVQVRIPPLIPKSPATYRPRRGR